MEKRRYINRHARVRTKEELIRREQVRARMRVAARIDDIRQELNLTVPEFAELLNKAPSEISDWLSGGHNFTQDTYTLIEVLTGKRIFEGIAVTV